MNRKRGMFFIFSLLLFIFCYIAPATADEEFKPIDTRAVNTVETKKPDTVIVNGVEYPKDQAPAQLATKISGSETGIMVYKNGGTDADHTSFWDGGVESVGKNGVIGATNVSGGHGIVGYTKVFNSNALYASHDIASHEGAGKAVYASSNSWEGYAVYAINLSPEDNTVNSDGAKGHALYAKGATDWIGALSINEHVAVIEDSGSDPSVLALYMSSIQSDELDSYNNFITFYTRDQNGLGQEGVGAIEGTSSGVVLDTGSSDFAEWLEKADSNEEIGPGDIVGISEGRISKTVNHADHFQVISTSPAVAGNSQGDDNTNYERVAFIGQVPTKVRGAVKSGDYILPSGDNDGIGIARPADQLTTDDLARIVGIAWSASTETEIKLINVAVGLENYGAVRLLHRQNARIAELELELSKKSSQFDRLAARFEQLDRRMAQLTESNKIALLK